MEFGFERLEAWKISRRLVKSVYEIVRSFPAEEKYCLSDQLRRASISVASNLAEGGGRNTDKERLRFCHMAYGSLMEVTCQLMLAKDLDLISPEQYSTIRSDIEELERVIHGYRSYLSEKSKNS